MATRSAVTAPSRRFADAGAAMLRLPAELRRSLHPETDDAARLIMAELETVRSNIRLLDHALPLVGALIVFVHIGWAPVKPMLAMLLVVALACVANETILLRLRPEASDLIGKTSSRARLIAFAATLLMSTWCLFALSLWASPASDIFPLLILSCTLAATTMMFSAHTATAMGATLALSLAIATVEFFNSYSTHSLMFILAAVYVVMMVVQSCSIHTRFERAWRLEQDREQLIKNLRVAHDTAVAASRAKSEFLANMSHELRTPLNAIIGFSDIVRSKAFGDSAEKYSEYGGFIHQSGNRLLELIGDILDLARIEAGRKVLQREPINLDDLIRDDLGKRTATAVSHGVELNHLREPGLPLLLADIHAVRQVIDNLVSNAIKFTPKGGRVWVGASLNVDGEIELSVADTGLGIAREEQARIFDRFGSGRPEITSAQRGTGLGLQIVKGLVDMHGGRIALMSTLGEGTRVTVVFPAASTSERRIRNVA